MYLAAIVLGNKPELAAPWGAAAAFFSPITVSCARHPASLLSVGGDRRVHSLPWDGWNGSRSSSRRRCVLEISGIADASLMICGRIVVIATALFLFFRSKRCARRIERVFPRAILALLSASRDVSSGVSGQ
jgi:hypothetical protein